MLNVCDTFMSTDTKMPVTKPSTTEPGKSTALICECTLKDDLSRQLHKCDCCQCKVNTGRMSMDEYAMACRLEQ